MRTEIEYSEPEADAHFAPSDYSTEDCRRRPADYVSASGLPPCVTAVDPAALRARDAAPA